MTGCAYFDLRQCASCSLLPHDYSAQLTRKLSFLTQTYNSLLDSQDIHPVIGSSPTLHSRNKAKMAVGGSVSQPILGYTDRAGQVFDIVECPLHVAPIPQILKETQAAISRFGVQPYNIQRRQGECKFVIVRASESSSEVMIRFVLRSKNSLEVIRALFVDLQARFPMLVVGSVNIQPVHQAIYEGPEEIILSERTTIVDVLAGRRLIFSPQSFSQVTSNIAKKLYEFVAQRIAEVKPKRLLDLYCGVGAFSIFSAPHCASGLGVELSEQAVMNAREAARLLSIPNWAFECGDVEQFLVQNSESPDAVIVNPPRRGLSPAIISRLIDVHPRTILYSSCNPVTQARDLKEFAARYQIRDIQAFDMFPLTEHVEAVATLDAK